MTELGLKRLNMDLRSPLQPSKEANKNQGCRSPYSQLHPAPSPISWSVSVNLRGDCPPPLAIDVNRAGSLLLDTY